MIHKLVFIIFYILCFIINPANVIALDERQDRLKVKIDDTVERITVTAPRPEFFDPNPVLPTNPFPGRQQGPQGFGEPSSVSNSNQTGHTDTYNTNQISRNNKNYRFKLKKPILVKGKKYQVIVTIIDGPLPESISSKIFITNNNYQLPTSTFSHYHINKSTALNETIPPIYIANEGSLNELSYLLYSGATSDADQPKPVEKIRYLEVEAAIKQLKKMHGRREVVDIDAFNLFNSTLGSAETDLKNNEIDLAWRKTKYATSLENIASGLPPLQNFNNDVLDYFQETQPSNINSYEKTIYSTAIAVYKTRISKIPPNTKERDTAKNVVIASVDMADSYLISDELNEAYFSMKMAKTLGDFLIGIDPITGTARDLYEALTGVNLVTNVNLTPAERGFATLGSLTLGAGSKMGKFSKVFIRLRQALEPKLKTLVSWAKITTGKIKKTDFVSFTRGPVRNVGHYQPKNFENGKLKVHFNKHKDKFVNSFGNEIYLLPEQYLEAAKKFGRSTSPDIINVKRIDSSNGKTVQVVRWNHVNNYFGIFDVETGIIRTFLPLDPSVIGKNSSRMIYVLEQAHIKP